jgi:alkanesulfonate monooxygenase SsuD/methylene tetrahydromethanopterin reductase-like flavin-dependent oxidoreductase (luciferase family)
VRGTGDRNLIDRLGIGLWTLQSSAFRPGHPTALVRRFGEDAALADELGFHSVWIAEHRLWYDGYCPAPLHAEAYVAACTKRIRLGQSMLVGSQHDPAQLARNAATLQTLSGGRLELGLGLGHRDAEFDALGLRRDRRGRRMEEEILPAVELVGARIWLGGMATPTLERAARRGHSLMLPQTIYTHELAPVLDEYRSLGGTGTIGIMRDAWIEPDPAKAENARQRVAAHYLEEAGSWWVLKGTVGFENPEQLERQRLRTLRAALIGSPEEIAERLRADVEAGVEVFALRLAYDFPSQAELREQLHRLAEDVAPLLEGL